MTKPSRGARHKFAAGDSVTMENKPFDFYEVISQLSTSGGELMYRVRGGSAPRNRSVRESEIVKLDDRLDDLLDAAQIKRKTRTIRDDLLLILSYGRLALYQHQQRTVPAAHLTKLEKSIEKTNSLLAEYSQKYNTAIGEQLHRDGDGVVYVQQVHDLKTIRGIQLCRNESEFPPEFSGRFLVAIKIQALLKAWHKNIKDIPRRTNRPKEQVKTDIVRYAKEFFCRHSPHAPSSDTTNPFRDFAELFYEVVTGNEPDDTGPSHLEYQIRQALDLKSAARYPAND